MKLPYLQIVRDRYGVKRGYVRRGNRASIRVKGIFGSSEFFDNYEIALATINSDWWASLSANDRRLLRDEDIILEGLKIVRGLENKMRPTDHEIRA